MKKQVIKVGFDFDGVIAYNPFRIIRFPVSFVKKKLLKVKKLKFFHPKNEFERIVWLLLHESSLITSKGTKGILKDLIDENIIEAHLITARYKYLENHLYKFLDRHQIKEYFSSIHINQKDEQPHLFKEKTIKKLDLDYFIEDNLDIVLHLKNIKDTKVLWIYNILDRFHEYEYKFPYLEKALVHIKTNHLPKKKK
jgi:hypothetical protein